MFMLVFLALLIEAVMGYPDWLVRSAGHPVMWMGRLIGFFDGTLNHDHMTGASRRAAGVVSLMMVIGAAGGIAGAL
jgi:adenosylcobinamide-phosphate synthase